MHHLESVEVPNNDVSLNKSANSVFVTGGGKYGWRRYLLGNPYESFVLMQYIFQSLRLQ
jgi:hypothetical protein